MEDAYSFCSSFYSNKPVTNTQLNFEADQMEVSEFDEDG
jgi:hypothetical protein